jgi:uncharacterized protein (TIGR03437 family)
MRSSILGATVLFSLVSAALSQNYSMQTIAGRTIVTEGGNATQSLLRYPISVAIDTSGNIFIADQDDNRVWKLDSSGKITTLAGNGVPYYGGDNGPGPNAALNGPTGLAVDSANNIYICDTGNNLVRKVTPSGVITSVAGNGSPMYSGDGGPATRAGVAPLAVAVDKAGDLFISEGARIREVSAATGNITTIAGTGTPGYSGDNGPAAGAKIGGVTGLAIDTTGTLYLADYLANVIRKIDTKNIITTIGGTGVAGYSGDGAPATTAQMVPYALAIDPAGTGLYLSEPLASTIRRIDFPTGRITIVAGSAFQYGFAGDGQSGLSAILWGPYGVAVDSAKNLVIADTLNQRVRKIAGTTGLVSTVAGTNPAGTLLNHPEGIGLDSKGNLNIADTGNNAVKQLTLNSGAMSTLPLYYAFNPEGVAEDSAGNLYMNSEGFADVYIYKYATSAQYSYVAGNGTGGFSGDNGQALKAMIGRATSIILDSSNSLYIADNGNSRVRKIDTTGFISTIAGNGSSGSSGDGGKATSAGMDPFDITFDRSGNIYLADRTNNRIRKFTPGGNISTVAGTGSAGFSGDNGPALSATLNSPTGVALDAAGNLFIADAGNAVLRKVTTDGMIHTVAGSGVQYPFNGDGPALQQNLSPYRVAVDSNGNVYVSDWANDRVRKLVPVNAAALAIVSGNNQTGAVGTALRQKLTVMVTGTDNNPFAGAAVTFAVTSGIATLTPSAPQQTANDGTASTAVTLGVTPGPVTVTATVAGLATVTFSLTATAAAVTPAALTIVSGDQQSGIAGTALAQKLVVKVTGSDMNPFAGASVTFAVASGSATLNPSTPQQTAADGTASTSVTLGATVGAVSVTASVIGLPTVSFSLTATASQNLPQIFTGGVVSAGLSAPPIQTASPNAILSIFGQNFAPAGTLRQVSGSDLVNGLVPTNLIGVCVTFGLQRAPIFLVAPGQLNVQAPQLPASGSVAVQVITNCDTPLQSASNTVAVAVQAAAPEFFYSSNSASGQNPIAAIDVNGAGVGDPNRLGAGFALAYPNEIIQIYATGLGLSNPSYTPGQLPPGGAPVSGVTVSIDGTPLSDSAIQYAGVAPLNAGLYQLNVMLPPLLMPGDHAITMAVNGVSSPAGSYLSVGPSPSIGALVTVR